jgi:hypothetical protein
MTRHAAVLSKTTVATVASFKGAHMTSNLMFFGKPQVENLQLRVHSKDEAR